MSRSLDSPTDGPQGPGTRRTGRAEADRRTGQVEPTAALVAVFAVCVGLSIYAGVLQDALPNGGDRRVASTAIDAVDERASTGGVLDPATLDRAAAAAPDGYRMNVTVAVGDRRWHVGPTPPGDIGHGVRSAARGGVDSGGRPADSELDRAVDAATRPVSVRRGAGSVRPGRLTVVVWR